MYGKIIAKYKNRYYIAYSNLVQLRGAEDARIKANNSLIYLSASYAIADITDFFSAYPKDLSKVFTVVDIDEQCRAFKDLETVVNTDVTIKYLTYEQTKQIISFADLKLLSVTAFPEKMYKALHKYAYIKLFGRLFIICNKYRKDLHSERVVYTYKTDEA